MHRDYRDYRDPTLPDGRATAPISQQNGRRAHHSAKPPIRKDDVDESLHCPANLIQLRDRATFN